MYQIAQTAHAYNSTYPLIFVPLVAAVVGVGTTRITYHGVHHIHVRRLDRLAQEQVRLHQLIRSDHRNQSIHHIVLMNTIRRMQSVKTVQSVATTFKQFL